MSLVRNCDVYRAYRNLCFYTGQIPLSKDKWSKQFNSTPNRNKRTVDDIKKELEEIREHT